MLLLKLTVITNFEYDLWSGRVREDMKEGEELFNPGCQSLIYNTQFDAAVLQLN